MNRYLCVAAALFGVACITDEPGIITTPGDTEQEGDTTPPAIAHDAVEGAQILGQPVSIWATVTDEASEVFVVQVFYRQETSSMWEVVALSPQDEQGTYAGYIPGEDVMTGGMYYYLYAMDTSENEGFDPPEGEDDAYHFRISPAD